MPLMASDHQMTSRGLLAWHIYWGTQYHSLAGRVQLLGTIQCEPKFTLLFTRLHWSFYLHVRCCRLWRIICWVQCCTYSVAEVLQMQSCSDMLRTSYKLQMTMLLQWLRLLSKMIAGTLLRSVMHPEVNRCSAMGEQVLTRWGLKQQRTRWRETTA